MLVVVIEARWVGEFIANTSTVIAAETEGIQGVDKIESSCLVNITARSLHILQHEMMLMLRGHSVTSEEGRTMTSPDDDGSSRREGMAS